jgi:hypothetical protein
MIEFQNALSIVQYFHELVTLIVNTLLKLKG